MGGGVLDVSNTFDHFSFHRFGRMTDSAWPSRKLTLVNRLLCRLMHTRGMPPTLPVTRSPGVSASNVQASTQALSANAGTLLDSRAGRVIHASRGPMP